jgi:hypothetical protein
MVQERLFSRSHLKVFSIDSFIGTLEFLGSATLRVNNEIIDNTTLLDPMKIKDYLAGEWSLDVEIAWDAENTKDFVALAQSQAKVPIAIECCQRGTAIQGAPPAGATVWKRAGLCLVASAEDVLEGPIRQRATFEGTGDLDCSIAAG